MEIKEDLGSKFKLEVHNDAPEKIHERFPPPYLLFQTQELQLSRQLCRLFFRVFNQQMPQTWNQNLVSFKPGMRSGIMMLPRKAATTLELWCWGQGFRDGQWVCR
jgi:hypothetical protein